MAVNSISPIAHRVIAWNVSTLLLASIAVTFRFISRLHSRQSIGPDDWTILIGLCLALGGISTTAGMSAYGIGYQMRQLSSADIQAFFKVSVKMPSSKGLSIFPQNLGSHQD